MHDGDRINTWPGPLAGEDREDEWDLREVKVGHDEDEKKEMEDNERYGSDTPLLLYSVRKRPLSSAKEKPCMKRC